MLKCGYCKDIPVKAYKEAIPMQIFKKALALVLTLALTLTCIPALAGTVSAADVPVFTDLQAPNVDPDITLHGVKYQAGCG